MLNSGNSLRNYLSIRKDQIGFLSGVLRDGGDIARFRLLAFPYVLVNDPALIREALVDKSESLVIRGGASAGLARLIGHGILTNRGGNWRASRTGLQPLFHQAAMKSYIPTIAARVEESLERWRAFGVDSPIDIQQELLALSFRITSSTLFGWLPSFEDAAEFAAAIRVLQLDGMERYMTGFDFAPWIPLPLNRRILRARSTLLRLAQSAAEHGGAQPVDEIRSIFFAGTESPANTICFALTLLEENPQWLAQIRDSARGAVGAVGAASLDELERFGPLAQVVSESLRLFPAGWAFERVAAEDVRLGGHPIRRGTRLLFSPFLLHRNRRFWREPERFDPERFAREPTVAEGVPKYGYLPFGAGPRSCIGMRLALAEMRIILGALVSRCRWRTQHIPGEKPLGAEGSFKIRLSRPLRVQIEVA
jgi:cytochrome P450